MRQTKEQRELYAKLKSEDSELFQLAEEIHATKNTQWVSFWLCIASIRNLINNKEEVLDIIKSLSFSMNSYKTTVERFEIVLNELDNLNK